MIDIIENKKNQLKNLSEKYQVKELYVFGSVNSNNFHETSDIDFLVSFKEMPLLDYSDNYFNFQDELGKLFERKIDLVIDKSITNPYLKSSIEKTMQIIYG